MVVYRTRIRIRIGIRTGIRIISKRVTLNSIRIVQW